MTENLTRAEAAERSSFLTTTRYEVALNLTTGPTTFLTETTIHVIASEARPVFVDLIAPEVLEIELNGTLLEDPASRFDGARVQLPELAVGANTVRITANGAYMNTGEGLHRFVDPADDEVYLYSQFEVSDARRMFACFEQPDLKAEFQFTVTAPAHWRLISVSPTPEPEDAGTDTQGQPIATWRFEPTEKISTYLTCLIAGPYEGYESTIRSSDGRELKAGVYARASLAQHLDGEAIVEVTQQGFDFFEEKFALPYPFRKYDQVFVPEYNMGAMEHPGAVTFTEVYVFRSEVSDAVRERRDLTILHELAHMWFGDLVTMRWWDDLWLNESFAEYASTLASAEATRWTNSWTTFAGSEKAWAYMQDQLPSTHPVVADMVDFDAVETNFDGITYAKGASVLRQLVAYVGEDAFFEGVRAYFQKHAWGNTELSDLLVELEATSGRDLRTWSALWLEQAGVTLLRPLIDRDDDGTVTRFAVAQETPAEHPTLRPHRLGIAGFTEQNGKLVRTEHVEVDVDGELTEIDELVGKQADLWLLNDGDLAYAKIRLDPDSFLTAMRDLETIEDPLARTLIWASGWDMVRDAEMPSRLYHQLLLDDIEGEADSSTVRTLLSRLEATSTHYSAPAQRRSRTAGTATALWALTEHAAAGSDAQLQYLECFLRLACEPEHVGAIEALLDGRLELPGRPIDADLRWKLVIALAANDAITDVQIDEILSRDNTQSGRLSALTAKAARPHQDVKKRAWEQVVEEDSLANESVTAVIKGFNHGDEQLLAPYGSAFFTMLDNVWATRSTEIANRLMLGLFPTKFPSMATVRQAEKWLAAHEDAPLGQRRPIMEGLDGVQRALRVQEADVEPGSRD